MNKELKANALPCGDTDPPGGSRSLSTRQMGHPETGGPVAGVFASGRCEAMELPLQVLRAALYAGTLPSVLFSS